MLRNEHYKDDMIYVTHVTRYVLTILGVWPTYNRRNSTGEKIVKYSTIFISYMFLFCVLFPGVFFWMIEKRIRVKIQTIPLLLFGFMACAKYGNLVFNQKHISRCLKHVEEDYRTVTNGEARERMIEFANVGRRLIILCSFLMYGNGVSYRLILPFARGKIVTAQNITIRPLPCPAYFIFFDIQESPIYELVFAAQVLSGAVTYMASTGICGLATTFAMHACGQLKIMDSMLRSLVEEQGQEKRQVDRKLAEIVEHQIRIRGFLDLVENTLQQACLIEVMGSTIVLCLVGYFIIMEWANSNTIAMTSYFISSASLLTTVFLYCYAGEQLVVQAEKVARTSCVLEWYRLSDKEARGIILVIIMSNKPVKITAGKIMDLSLKTYGDIVKTSLTYFNMLVNLAV